MLLSSVQFGHSVVSDPLRPHESQHTRPPCPSPTPGVHSDSCPSSQWCHPAISSSVDVAAAAKSLQSCLTLGDPIDSSHQAPPVPGILQARTLEWVAISFSNAGKWKVKVKSVSRVRLLATPWTAAHQAPPSMEFSRQITGVGCHCLLRLMLLEIYISMYKHICLSASTERHLF